jgi:hypothetical protein
MPIVLDGTVGITTPTEQVATTIGVGNATPSTSGAGITFPATQSASTNANTLDDYEEGTWTPNQGGGLTVVGAFSSVGYYTKVGRVVTVTGVLSATTSIAFAGNATITSNLPFSVLNKSTGCAVNNGNTAGVFINPEGSIIYASGSMAATPNIPFSVTYFV